MENTANKNLIYTLHVGMWSLVFLWEQGKRLQAIGKVQRAGGRKVSVSNKKPSTSFRVCGGVECQSAYSGGLNRRANF